MTAYKVTEILSQKPWPAEGETKTIYYNFKVEGDDRTINVGRKPGNDLRIGSTLEGTIAAEPERGVHKFTRSQPQGGAGFQGGRPRDPAERRSIEMQHAQKCATELLRVFALSNPDTMPGTVNELTRWAKTVAGSLFAQIEEAVKGDVTVPKAQPVRRDVERTGKSDITSTEDIDALTKALKYDGPQEDIPFPTKAEADAMREEAQEANR